MALAALRALDFEPCFRPGESIPLGGACPAGAFAFPNPVFRATLLASRQDPRELADVAEQLAAENRAAAKALTEAKRCKALFNATADRKASDLTMRETQQIDACRIQGLYQ